MQPVSTVQYLSDMARSIAYLTEFTRGKTYNDYAADALLRSAVERQFEIIGEALNQLLRRDPTLASRITNWKRIISFRNRLVHGYATIDDAVVWGVLEENLSTLREEVSGLLDEMKS